MKNKENMCGCFYCFEEFPVSEIQYYLTTEMEVQEALCPYCGIDSLLPSNEYKDLDHLKEIGKKAFSIADSATLVFPVEELEGLSGEDDCDLDLLDEVYPYDEEDNDDFFKYIASLTSEELDNSKDKSNVGYINRYRRRSKIDFLRWVGIGSSWSGELLNTSAYMLKDNNLVLIDCGSLIFNKLLKEGILDQVENATILITHLHGDHVGSLVDTIMYLYYVRNVKANIIFQGEEIIDLLEIQGLDLEACNFTNRFIGNIDSIMSIDLGIDGLELYDVREVSHVDTLNCYSYDLMYNGEIYVFSGDIKHYPDIINDYYKQGILAEAYLDTSIDSYKGVPHMTLAELIKQCPAEMREHVFCIHLKDREEFYRVISEGFSVPDFLD